MISSDFSPLPNVIMLIPLVSVIFSGCRQPSPKSPEPEKKAYAIAIHGGAGTPDRDMPDELREKYLRGLEEALARGTAILKEGGSALDAVEESIRILEDDALFNAGKGAVFTHEERNELDAAIMDGSRLNAGAVTGVRTVKHPVSLARKVMEESKHVFFSWEGAEKFADQFEEIERVDPTYFRTERRLKALKKAKKSSSYQYHKQKRDNRYKFGTVGCVALDKKGNLAAGTSTGGMTNKMFGRIGDVPIIGAGTYADSVVAVSATGWGEKIILNVTSHSVASFMKFKEEPLETATNYVIHKKMSPNTAGVIAVDQYGNISMPFNTVGMFRAAADSEGLKTVKIWN